MQAPDNSPGLNFVGPSDEGGVSLQVAPLIDIVFQLICFYLLVGQLMGVQKDPSVSLAVMANPAVAVEQPAELVINLRQDGSLVVGGQPIQAQHLARLLVDDHRRAEQEGQPWRVVVRADRRQRSGNLDAVLEACRQAGVDRIVFRAETPEGP